MKYLAIVLFSLVVLVGFIPNSAAAAPPVKEYWSCKADIHSHVHINRPSKGHMRKHRCRPVDADPWTLPDPPGPKPETATEANYRIRAQAAERRIQELGRELWIANQRIEQVRLDTEAAMRLNFEPVVAEVLDLRSWANQLERLGRYLLNFLADTPAANVARVNALFVLNSH